MNVRKNTYNYRKLDSMYREGSVKLKKGLPIDDFQVRLCAAAAHAMDFIDYGKKEADYQKLKACSVEIGDTALWVCTQCYAHNMPKTPEEIPDFISLLTKQYGSYELFGLCNFINDSVPGEEASASIAYKTPTVLEECKDYPMLNGLHLLIKFPKTNKEITFDVYKKVNEAIKSDCSFDSEIFAIGLPSFHDAVMEMLKRVAELADE